MSSQKRRVSRIKSHGHVNFGIVFVNMNDCDSVLQQSAIAIPFWVLDLEVCHILLGIAKNKLTFGMIHKHASTYIKTTKICHGLLLNWKVFGYYMWNTTDDLQCFVPIFVMLNIWYLNNEAASGFVSMIRIYEYGYFSIQKANHLKN